MRQFDCALLPDFFNGIGPTRTKPMQRIRSASVSWPDTVDDDRNQSQITATSYVMGSTYAIRSTTNVQD